MARLTKMDIGNIQHLTGTSYEVLAACTRLRQLVLPSFGTIVPVDDELQLLPDLLVRHYTGSVSVCSYCVV